MSKQDSWMSDKGAWWTRAYMWPSKGHPGPEPWGRYAYSFKEAADRLLGPILRGERAGIDLLVVPIFYLYRHWIELTTKASIRDLCRHLGKELPAGRRKSHDLGRWDQMIALATELHGKDAPPHREADRFVRELRQLDPEGETFRYPEKLNGQSTWFGPDWINLQNFAQGIEHVETAIFWVEGVLNGADDAVN